MPVKSTDLSVHQRKWISGTLIERSALQLRLAQFASPNSLDDGNGTTATFVGYRRTDVVVDKLAEGVTPSETAFTNFSQTITVDHWGMFIALTDVSTVTTAHPVLNEALDLVADATARTVDYNHAEVLNGGTNVQFWDGTRANRGAITATDVFNKNVATKARVDLNNAAAPAWKGDFYAAVCSASVEGDVLAETATVGGFTAAAQMQDMAKLEAGTLGNWLGFQWIRSNFLPRFTRLASVPVVTPGGGGSLTGTVYYKLTRKNLTRGFEEDIGVEASVAMGADTSLAFTFPNTTGYVFNLYIGAATGDSNLYLATENRAAGSSVTITLQPGSGRNPGQTPAVGVTVHPIYIFGAKSFDNVSMNSLNMKGTVTPPGSSDSDPLEQRRKVGAKWANKSGIRDATRLKRIELASNF